MPRVILEPGSVEVRVEPGTSLMDAIRSSPLPLGSACGGEGVCARCRVRVVSGGENLSPPDAMEQRIATLQRLRTDERVACRARVLGDVVVTSPSWGSCE